MKLFRRRVREPQFPERQSTTRAVDVTPVQREPSVEGLAYAPDAETARHIRAHLPNHAPTWAPRRAMLVLRAYAQTLRTTGHLSELDRTQLIAAIESLTEFADAQLKVVR